MDMIDQDINETFAVATFYFYNATAFAGISFRKSGQRVPEFAEDLDRSPPRSIRCFAHLLGCLEFSLIGRSENLNSLLVGSSSSYLSILHNVVRNTRTQIFSVADCFQHRTTAVLLVA